MENTKSENIFHKIYNQEWFKMVIDFSRIVMVLLLILLIIYVWKNVEAVKLLSMDSCKICMDKSGCSCFCLGELG
jgi:uncharacterized integral membrane protein